MYHPDMIIRIARDRDAARLADAAYNVPRSRRLRRRSRRVPDHPPSPHVTFPQPHPAPAA